MSLNAITTFYYCATAADGRTQYGSLDARNVQDVSSRLRDRGLTPLEIDVRQIKRRWSEIEFTWPWAQRIGDKEAAQFCQELDILLSAGLDVAVSIEAMRLASRPGSRRERLVSRCAEGLRQGKTLSAALSESGYRLPSELIAALRAAEGWGDIAQALKSVASSLTRRQQFRDRVSSAAAYPIFIVCVVIAALIIFSTWVAPALVNLFISMDREPPMSLSVLNAIPHLARQYWTALLLGVLLVATGIAWLFRSPLGNRILNQVVVRLPLVSGIACWSAVAKFSSAMRLSLATGRASPEAVEAALRAAGRLFAPQASWVSEQLRIGRTLGTALNSITAFPLSARHLIEIGESGSRLAESFRILEEQAIGQVDRRSTLIASLLGPALIVLVGAVVGSVIFSVFSALMEINNFVS